ncbi:hypothetical protein AA313_de0207294 [Arthrobotrys entomopaga]|nr:hypothetical protein AA313_de0207294 [Arthrobotrys entomopaga]
MFKTIAFLSALGAVVAPPPKPGPYLSINTSPTLKPIVTPPTVLIDSPQSQNVGIDISSATQSQYTPPGGSRSLSKEESTMFGGGYNPSSGISSPLNNTPRSARRQELRFLTANQKKSGMLPAPIKSKRIDWDDWAGAAISGVIPTSEGKIMKPSNSRYTGPGPKLRHENTPSPRYNPVMLAPTQPDDDDDGLDYDDSWDESEYLGIEDMPSTKDVPFGPELTPRVEKFMSSRARYYQDGDIDASV